MCSNYAPRAKKLPHPRDHMFYSGLYKENIKKIFLSETIRPKALIFGLYLKIRFSIPG